MTSTPQPRAKPDSVESTGVGAIRSRIAPTPSGYLHVGNAVNFLLTSWLVRERGGRLALRIDDIDQARCRPEYVEDIFRSLDWLGIDCDEGPDGPDSFYRDFTMADRGGHYRVGLDRLAAGGIELYGCACSRKSRAVAAASAGSGAPGTVAASGCPGGCRELRLPMVTGQTAVRMHVPTGSRVAVGDRIVDLNTSIGDPILWRRDGVAAYQLASVIEDRDMAVTAIVRGEDLLASSALQVMVAPQLGARLFAAADFRHHGLVTGRDGVKLSKSVESASLRDYAGSTGLWDRIRRVARRLGEPIDIHQPDGC